MNWNIALLLNESDILSLGHDLSGGLIKKNTNPSLVFKLLPLKITIDIPIIILYIIKLQLLKYGLRVVTSNMQTLIRFDLEYEVGKEFKKKTMSNSCGCEEAKMGRLQLSKFAKSTTYCTSLGKFRVCQHACNKIWPRQSINSLLVA